MFQGFCGWSLVVYDRLLVPSNPANGVLRYKDNYYAFSHKQAAYEFANAPDRYETQSLLVFFLLAVLLASSLATSHICSLAFLLVFLLVCFFLACLLPHLQARITAFLPFACFLSCLPACLHAYLLVCRIMTIK